jgi:eukaryotic-like serine/threonine-protein kinase
VRRDPSGEFIGTDRFQIVRRLGGGTMGVVYEAHDRERNARVALKTLRSASPDTLQRFKNEFRWLQDLHHPNVVSFGELFSESGRWFFTMELVDGVDFVSWVRPIPAGAQKLSGSGEWSPDTLDPAEGRRLARLVARAPLDESRLRAALVQLARGLAALHRAHKVHRDVKPANLLVTPAGRVVVVDFGLARDARAQRSGEHVVGTAEYMAPEQAASKTVGPAADWYAVGAVLYEALTGRAPFSGSPLEVLINKQTMQPSPPHTREPTVPRDLEALCMDLLRVDPAARPTGDEVLRRLGDAAPADAAPPLEREPFVGREPELQALRGALVAAVEGATAVTMLVHGESGVGKSALVRRFTEEIGAQALVLAGRCYERESVPYKAVDGVIDALSRHVMRLRRDEAEALLPPNAVLLAQVFPVLRRVEAVSALPLERASRPGPQETRARVFAALRALFARLAADRPLVIAIDDLQWSDADSIALLAEVLRGPDAPRILLTATVRGESDAQRNTDLMRALGGPGLVRHLEVKRLSHDDARALARALSGETGAQVDAIADEAGGHPLFIDELVRAARHAGGSAPGKLRFDDAVRSRVQRLEPTVRQLLELVVVAGGPLAQEVFATAAAVDFGELGRRIAQLRSAQLVRTTGARRTDAVEPYHDRVRAAVDAQLDARTRKRWHERLALALEAAGARATDPETLSVHWNGAGDPERAAHYAGVAASQAAEALAFDRAARLYRLAIELRPIEGAAFQARLGDVLASAGRGPEAARAYLQAAEGANARESVDLRRRAAEQLLVSGHIDSGLDALQTVLRAAGMTLPKTPARALRSLWWSRTRLRLRGLGFRERDPSQVPPSVLARIDTCWSVGVGLALVDPLRSFDFQTRHARLALDAGEPYRVARGLCAEAVYLSAMGAYARAERVLERAQGLVKTIDSPHTRGLHAMASGVAAFIDGAWKTAATALAGAEQIFREQCTGMTWELDTSEILHLLSRVWLGQVAAASERVPGLLRDAIQRGDRYAATNLRTAMHVARLAADDPDGARRESADAIRQWSHRGFHTQHNYDLIAQTNAAIYAGDGIDAERIVRTAWPQLAASHQLRTPGLRVQALDLRARACAAAARHASGATRKQLVADVARDARRIARLGMRISGALAGAHDAAVTALRGDPLRAAELLADAERAFAAADMALHAHAMQRRRGELLGGAAGAELVAQADAWFARERIKSPVRFATLLTPGIG